MLKLVVILLLGLLLGSGEGQASRQGLRWLAANQNLFEPLYSDDEDDIGTNLQHSEPNSKSLKDTSTIKDSLNPTIATAETATTLQSNDKTTEDEESEKKQVERKQETHHVRHLSGLENYYEMLRKSLRQAPIVGLNTFQQREGELARLVGLKGPMDLLNNKLSQSSSAKLKRRQPREREESHKGEESASGTTIDYGPWPTTSLQQPKSIDEMLEQHVERQLMREQRRWELFGELAEDIQQQQAEEMACGPRNYIMMNTTSNSNNFGEFPSHAGIYKANTFDDMDRPGNFLCGATYLHSQFVLTLASCVMGWEPSKLKVRLGEWNLNKGTPSKPTILTHVDRLFIFPAYLNGSLEHNLALVRLVRKLDYTEWNYISPACLPNAFNPHGVRECRTPVRQMGASEYLDVDGDGETKVRRWVEMAEGQVEFDQHNTNDCSSVEPYQICAKFNSNQTTIKEELGGSGIYCSNYGLLSLMSIMMPPMASQQSNATHRHLLDLTFYRPWLRNITLM